MIDYLLYILNHSLSAGYFPDKLKHAIMIYIPKGQLTQYRVPNYRGLSMLDIHGKLFEKTLGSRLEYHNQLYDHHNTHQHGFRLKRGTHTALATLHETISNDLANKHSIDIVLRDVSKAFDKVWHTGLKYKIHRLQLHPCLQRTLADFITDRTASVRIDNYIGPPFPLESGVPQGACLSPTLYSLYTQDIPTPTHNTDYIAFADDITQISSGRHKPREAARTTARAIDQMNTYENKWKIQTNTNKFAIIPISRNTTHPITLQDDTVLPYTKQGKVLGLHFSSTGITKQVTHRTNIAQANITKLHRFRGLSQYNKLKIYKSTILSALIYPTVPLNTISKTSMIKLQRKQNRALRFITNTRWTDYRTSESLHEQCNIEPINMMIHRQAKNTWETMKQEHPETYQQLIDNSSPITTQRNIRFPSSRLLAEGPDPTPIYT